MSNEFKVKSLHKALTILDCFSKEKPELGITEISERLNLYKSNVHNIVDTFAKMGYLEKNMETQNYRLGFKILELGQIIIGNMSFRTLLLPYIQRLADQVGEVVYLAIPKDAEVMYLDAAYPKNQLPTRSMLGQKAPMYCTGIGKAMLAHLSESIFRQVIDKGLVSFTEHTITQEEQLGEELVVIRKRGYSIDNMEHEYGIKCVAMPLCDRKGQVLAGISISGPSLRLDDSRIQSCVERLSAIRREVEEKL